MVFQNPAGSMNPRRSVGASVAEPLWAKGIRNTKDQVDHTLNLVGLNPKMADRMPHQMSGGQQQRASIARALIGDPALVVHDESIASLDISLQAQILNLLVDLQERLGTAYLFISHDLAAVQAISHRVAVIYLGEVVETATAQLFAERPLHPYSVALRRAALVPDPVVERNRPDIVLKGDVPSPLRPPSGCRFRTRCPLAAAQCSAEKPALRDIGGGHMVACHFPGESEGIARTALQSSGPISAGSAL
jgi:oligopeptide/dipeptide ABC transporter ATP-binding protein